MKILIACEESQTVTAAFRVEGIEAYSCDLLPTSGAHPEWHIQDDVLQVLFDPCWQAVIAFPPCTDLSASGAKHFAKKRADGRQQKSIDFFMLFASLSVPYAIENPVGIMSTIWRKPDQIINPWQFGDPFSKATCLWLNHLPKLQPTAIVDKGPYYTSPSGKRIPQWYTRNKSSRIRSKTFPGIANAMATQWKAAILQGGA